MSINTTKKREHLSKLLAQLPEPLYWDKTPTLSHIAGWMQAIYNQQTPGVFNPVHFEAGMMAGKQRKKMYRTTVRGLTDNFEQQEFSYNCRLSVNQAKQHAAKRGIVRDLVITTTDTLTGVKNERRI